MRPVARSIIRNAVSRAITDPGVGGGAILDPADLFTGGYLGDHWDAFDLSKLKQNSGGTGAVTTTGDPVGYMLGHVNGHAFIQPIALFRFTYRPGYLECSSAGGTFMYVDASDALFKFLHDGSGCEVLIALRAGTVSDPNAQYGLIGTCGLSAASTGLLVQYDDRAGSSRSNALRVYHSNGTGLAGFDSVTQNAIPANTDVVVGVSFATASTPDASIRVDNVELAAPNASAVTAANSQYYLSLGGTPSGLGATNSSLNGAILAVLVINRVLTSQERVGWINYVAANA